jgi:hypothetical protein
MYENSDPLLVKRLHTQIGFGGPLALAHATGEEARWRMVRKRYSPALLAHTQEKGHDTAGMLSSTDLACHLRMPSPAVVDPFRPVADW